MARVAELGGTGAQLVLDQADQADPGAFGASARAVAMPILPSPPVMTAAFTVKPAACASMPLLLTPAGP